MKTLCWSLSQQRGEAGEGEREEERDKEEDGNENAAW